MLKLSINFDIFLREFLKIIYANDNENNNYYQFNCNVSIRQTRNHHLRINHFDKKPSKTIQNYSFLTLTSAAATKLIENHFFNFHHQYKKIQIFRKNVQIKNLNLQKKKHPEMFYFSFLFHFCVCHLGSG